METKSRQRAEIMNEINEYPEVAGDPVIIEFTNEIQGQNKNNINSERVSEKKRDDIFPVSHKNPSSDILKKDPDDGDEEIVFNEDLNAIPEEDLKFILDIEAEEPDKKINGEEISGLNPKTETMTEKDPDELIILSNEVIKKAHNMKNRNQPLWSDIIEMSEIKTLKAALHSKVAVTKT